jgi:hypothetical protein
MAAEKSEPATLYSHNNSCPTYYVYGKDSNPVSSRFDIPRLQSRALFSKRLYHPPRIRPARLELSLRHIITTQKLQDAPVSNIKIDFPCKCAKLATKCITITEDFNVITTLQPASSEQPYDVGLNRLLIYRGCCENISGIRAVTQWVRGRRGNDRGGCRCLCQCQSHLHSSNGVDRNSAGKCKSPYVSSWTRHMFGTTGFGASVVRSPRTNLRPV